MSRVSPLPVVTLLACCERTVTNSPLVFRVSDRVSLFSLTMYTCSDPVQRIEQSQRGALYMCSVVPGCKRTYLSQRDLQAHVNHRHLRAAKSAAGRQEPVHLPPQSEVPDRFRVPPPHLPKNHVHLPGPLQHGGHDPYGQPPPPASHEAPPPPALGPETFRISTVTTRKHSNLITVPIQDDSSSSREPLSGGPAQPPHHHPGDYPGQPPVGSHSHHMMAPPQQHFGPPPPPPPPISHPMQHPAQASGTPHMVYNQAPPPPHVQRSPAHHSAPGPHYGPDAPLYEPPAAGTAAAAQRPAGQRPPASSLQPQRHAAVPRGPGHPQPPVQPAGGAQPRDVARSQGAPPTTDAGSSAGPDARASPPRPGPLPALLPVAAPWRTVALRGQDSLTPKPTCVIECPGPFVWNRLRGAASILVF